MPNLFFFIISNVYAQEEVKLDNPVLERDLVSFLERIALTLLPIAAGVFLVMLAVGGILYMTSAGNEAQAEKAKNALVWAVIGIIIVGSAWAIESYIRANQPF